MGYASLGFAVAFHDSLHFHFHVGCEIKMMTSVMLGHVRLCEEMTRIALFNDTILPAFSSSKSKEALGCRL